MGFTIAGFLVAIAGSLAYRVLAALGIGVITYTGLSAAIGLLASNVGAAFSAASPVIDLMLYAGFGHVLGITIAAFVTRAAMVSISKFGKIA